MKTVGIITMHRVVNYGSALQAWATVEILKKMGYDAKLIDYLYPNGNHYTQRAPITLLIIRFIKNLIQGFPMKRKKKNFERFWKRNYILTRAYDSEKNLAEDPPLFDTYLVGSDQVWNFDYIKNDSSFFLAFVPNSKRKMSYASSFSKVKLDEEQALRLRKHLQDFQAVSVRERNGYEIVKDIYDGNVYVHLDPTLLLGIQDYNKLIIQSTVKIEEPYILVYVLNYAYNPYPFVTKFIEAAANKLKMKVICIDFSARQHLHVKDMLHLHDAIGPCEFLWLFAHASLVITTSFHGTAFAINFNKPFYSIINDVNDGDDRMKSLIKQCGIDNRMIIKNSVIPNITLDVNYTDVNNRLNKLRKESIDYLKLNLQ